MIKTYSAIGLTFLLCFLLLSCNAFEEPFYFDSYDQTYTTQYTATPNPQTTDDNYGNDAVPEADEIIYANFACENDFTIVGDEIWSSKNEDSYTRIVRYKISNNVLVKQGEIIFSDVIHLNTLDYCPETDSLITGNGANDMSTENNCFWIIPNASLLSSMEGKISLDRVAIRYNVDIGFKVQAIWGEDNAGEYNVVYLLSNNNEIRKAVIHKNENGTFSNQYTMVGEVGKITGAAGFQGLDYFDGYLYFGYGGLKQNVAKVSMGDFSVEIIEYTYYDQNNAAVSGVFQGVVVDSKYIWHYPNGIKEGNYLIRYTR